jgi:RNase H-fold protein (predicted Holliday junction resolvase)
MKNKIDINSPKVLGLDVSTKTIGIALFDTNSEELLELTHLSPVPKSEMKSKIEELIVKSNLFKVKLDEYKDLGITKVVIEEPLLTSNNVNTVGVLMRFNTLVCKEVFDVLGLMPEFISTYNARKFAYPELFQKNDKGREVLFGGYDKTIYKKNFIWELVSKKEPQISWHYNKNNKLKKENFDQTDAYTAVLGYMKMKNIW